MTLNLGAHLVTLDHISAALAGNLTIGLDQKRRIKLEKGYDYLQRKIADPNKSYYGINTGFGDLCNHTISNADLLLLQERLIKSHACGTGDIIPESIARLILLLKIENISQGHSGASPALIDQLIGMYQSGISPVIKEQGSLGASGDLAPLAHLGLAIMGEGQVWLKGEITEASAALAQGGMTPYALQAKEGLAILNGTQFSNAFCLHGLIHGLKLWKIANYTAALSIDAFECQLTPYDPRIHNVRPHEGQIKTAQAILEALEDREAPELLHKIQDPYAFRCIPQVHGASWDTMAFVKKTALIELNSVTDNPLIFPNSDGILSGGNFHAQPLALANDFLAIALSELGSISERRIFQLISGERKLPAFLCADPGLNSGLMIPQYTAASIASQNKQLCTPASVDSIVSSNGQEDHVSMAANAGTKLARVVENIYRILAIEWMTAAQAMHFRRPRKTSSFLEHQLKAYRELVPVLEEDRILATDIELTVDFLKKFNV